MKKITLATWTFVLLTALLAGCSLHGKRWPVDLSTVPQTWSGQVSCPGCVERQLTVTLFPDGSFHLRDEFEVSAKQPESFYDVGLWQRQGKLLQLKGANEPTRWFAMRGHGLELLDDQKQSISSIREYRLSPKTLDTLRGPMLSAGVIRLDGQRVRYRECASEREFEVLAVSNAQIGSIKKALAEHQLNGHMLVSLYGQPQTLLQAGNATWQWVRPEFRQFWPNQTCADMRRQGSVPLREVTWQLQQLNGKAFVMDRMTQRPHLLIDSSSRVYGFSGCNRFDGRAKARGTQLSITAMAKTRMACAPQSVSSLEQDWMAALAATTDYFIQGHQLQLMQGDKVLAVLSAHTER